MIANVLCIVKKKRLAMLDLLIAVQRERKDIDDLGIREEVDTFIFEVRQLIKIRIFFEIGISGTVAVNRVMSI